MGIIAVKVQIRWWPELEGVCASGQCPVPQLIQLHRCQRAYAIEEAAELEDGQIWVWGRKSVKAGLGLHHWQRTSQALHLHIAIANDGIVTLTGTALLPGRSAGRSAG